MKIITISREFGSGGRELGKRLADALGIPCYDREIIDMVAEKNGFDKGYIANISEKDIRVFYPSTIAQRLISPHPIIQQKLQVMNVEHNIIKQLADQGDCVIIGRCADVILRDMNPMNIFVYADEQSKLVRCKQRAEENEHFSERELLKRIKKIDKERAAYRELFTENGWGRKESYHLCINTSGKEIKTLIPAIAEYTKLWQSQK